MILFQLRCPKCKNSQNYQFIGGEILKKKKRCVYCGKTFSVKFCREKIIQKTT